MRSVRMLDILSVRPRRLSPLVFQLIATCQAPHPTTWSPLQRWPIGTHLAWDPHLDSLVAAAGTLGYCKKW